MTRERDQLFAELSRAKFPIFPESETMFFMKIVDMTLRFEADEKGKAVAVMMGRGNGKETRVPRVPEESGGEIRAKRSVAPQKHSGDGG